MKKLIPILILAFIAASPARALAQTNIESDPAYLAIDQAIDVKVVRPEVNINLPRFLLKDALSEMNGGPDDPFAKAGINLAELTQDIKLIRVMVIEANETNRVALTKGVAALRSTLDKNWMPIAVIPDGGVSVYALSDPSGEKLAGLAVVIHDGDDAVIANIVGHVSLGKLVKIASNMDKFPKDLLKKLTEANKGDPEKPEPKSEKPAN